MAVELPRIDVWFSLPYQPGAFFTMDDPVRGVLDNTTYLLAGDVAVDISADLFQFTVRRGRTTERDDIAAGTLTAQFENLTRTLDALNTAGPYYGELKAGKRVVVTMYGIPLYDGRTENWDPVWPTDGMPTATLTAVDELGQLARREFDAWTTTAGQTAGPRLEDILNRNEVKFGANRDLDVGVATMQADNVTWGSNVLNYAQLVTRTDGGRLYVSRDGVLTFDDRRSLIGLGTVAVEFRDDGAGVEFHDVAETSASKFQVNRVGVDRLNGTLQTVEDVTVNSEDGVRSLSVRDLLMDSDAQALETAEYLLNIYKDPTTRVSAVTVNVSQLPAGSQATVAGLDIGDLVRVVWTPGATGASDTQLLSVEGVDHEWSMGASHWMTIYTAPIFQSSVMILDDPVYGVLDSTVTRLAY